DYFDSIEDEYNPFASPLHGGSGAIQYELISREQTLLLSFITGITGTGFAFWILVERWNVNVFFLGILAVGIAILFSTPPFKLGSRGLGEILSSIEIGLLPFVGTYMYLSTKEFTIEFLLVGSYLVVLLFSWFLLTNLLDFIPDIRAEKRTLPTLIGQSRAIGLFKILFIGSFLIWSGILIIQQNGIYLIPIGLGFFLMGWKKVSVPFQINDQAIKQILISNLLQLTLLTTALFF
ncbi:MAG: prenyltransferase, partial [Methanobacteriota archaeon]